jgi:hypothetical protein
VTPTQDSLRGWHDFFLLLGGASATLLGLVFVSVALVVNLPTLPEQDERDLFSTPIVAQFSYALGLSALSLAPWREVRPYGAVVALLGVLAVFQTVRLTRRMWRRHRDKVPASSGVWLTVAIAPLISASLCAVSGLRLLTGDLRGVDTLGVAIALLDINALINSWRLFLWILEQHPKNRA